MLFRSDIAIIDPTRGQQPTGSFAVDGFCGLSMLHLCRMADLISRAIQLPGQNVSESGLKEQRQVIAKVTGCREHARNGMAGDVFSQQNELPGFDVVERVTVCHSWMLPVVQLIPADKPGVALWQIPLLNDAVRPCSTCEVSCRRIRVNNVRNVLKVDVIQ